MYLLALATMEWRWLAMVCMSVQVRKSAGEWGVTSGHGVGWGVTVGSGVWDGVG